MGRRHEEGHIVLSVLRRDARSMRYHSTVLVSVGENPAQVLARGVGRAKCPDLNKLCQHVAALQLAADVDWRRRHIVSASNPSDADSRLADAGVLSAGEALVGPALDRRLAGS